MPETDPTTRGTSGKSGGNVIPLSQAPAAERPSDKVVAFVKGHPVLIATGAIAAGMLVSALLPRGTGRRLVRKAVDFAEASGAASLLLGREAGGKARILSDGARERASIFAGKAEKAGEAAFHNAEKYGLAAKAAATALGRATAKRAGHLGAVAADSAGKLGNIATQKSAQVADLAGELRHRIQR